MNNTFSSSWRRLAPSNVAVAAFSEPAEYLAAAPAAGAGHAVLDLMSDTLGWATDKVHVPKQVAVQFFGNDTANDQFLVYVRGYRQLSAPDDSTYHNLWLKTVIAEFTCTLGAGTLPGTNEFTVDTIVLDVGDSNLHSVLSPTGDAPSYALIDPLGCRYLDFWFAGTGTAATHGNAFVRAVTKV